MAKKKKADLSQLIKYVTKGQKPVPANHFKLKVLYPGSKTDPTLNKQHELNRKNIGRALAEGRIPGVKEVTVEYDENGDVADMQYSRPYVDADVAAACIEKVNSRFQPELPTADDPQPELDLELAAYEGMKLFTDVMLGGKSGTEQVAPPTEPSPIDVDRIIELLEELLTVQRQMLALR